MRHLYFSILFFCAVTLHSQDTILICHQQGVQLFSLENLNTKSIEFSPAYYQNGIVFVVAREKQRFLDPKTGRAYFDLMYADIGPDGTTGKVVSFSPNIRTQYHEGPCAFAHDGTELFFTRSNVSGGTGIEDEDGEVQLKIYSATKGAEDWENITQLSFSSDVYSVAHPTLSADGMYMVFASDMPGGQGGMDLYMTNRLLGDWSFPVNLGAQINTKGNEIFPYWHPQGSLIYASDASGGMGGLDLYACAWNGMGGFTSAQHLDEPFNSKKDDLGLIISEDGRSGYLASDRKPTKGKDDLYRWTSPVSVFCALPKESLIPHTLYVRDELASAIHAAHVWIIPMGQEGPSAYKDHFTTELAPKPDKEGAFYLRWGMTDTLSTATADAVSDIDGSARLNATPGRTYAVVVQRDGYIPYVEVFPQASLPNEVFLKKAPEVKATCLTTRFEVFDESGKTPLNGAGISIASSNAKEKNQIYTDEFGKATYCLPAEQSVRLTFEQEGYAAYAYTFTATEENELLSVYLKSSETLTAPPSPIVSGTVIVLDNIYYDFNKSEIRKGDAGELIALSETLKQYPDLKIELTSHTDTRGTAEYNMELSRRRSESSKSYLVLQGINPNRIITHAAGETQPRNHCVDDVPCTESEHQYNRRTEVKIINPAEGMVIRYKAEG